MRAGFITHCAQFADWARHMVHQLHADMVGMIVDAACALADRLLSQGDPEGALWAVGQGRLCAPLDDSLAVREIDALAALGHQEETKRAVLRLNRALRAEARDLEPGLAVRVQHAMRPRRRLEADA